MTEQQNLPARIIDANLLEKVVIQGDLAKLEPTERLNYYRAVCESLGINPLTKPFDYITLNNRLTLYATKGCTDQIRAKHGISLTITSREFKDESNIYIVTAKATAPDGRTDESTGVVSTKSLVGDFLANALMKAETKAKRRVTLSIVGLGLLDETDISTIPEAKVIEVDQTTGEIKELPKADKPVFDEPAMKKWARSKNLTQADLDGIFPGWRTWMELTGMAQTDLYKAIEDAIFNKLNPPGRNAINMSSTVV